MEHRKRKSVLDKNPTLKASEQTRQTLGSQALTCESCGQEQLPQRGYVQVPVEVREYGSPRPTKPKAVKSITPRNTPIRNLAREANEAEKRARLEADHSFYRAVARRRAEESS